jgi:hypothetical protein
VFAVLDIWCQTAEQFSLKKWCLRKKEDKTLFNGNTTEGNVREEMLPFVRVLH